MPKTMRLDWLGQSRLIMATWEIANLSLSTASPEKRVRAMSPGNRQLKKEVERRRTFAIISHPDAGKTMLTEKLLLFGGAIREAGAVRAQKANRHATSDWLELEKQRGISVSSSVMSCDYEGHRINILDTPGHKDFSEDTYRTLMAADCVVMLIDGAKGVEAQTRKLFEVCRIKRLPIFTFVNKWDRHGRDPLDLMSEIEEVLGIDAVPVNWPIGAGSEFRGVYDRLNASALLFEGGKHGTEKPEQRSVPGAVNDESVRAVLGAQADEVGDALELLDGAGSTFSLERVQAGEQTPMFFGSALTNFGVFPFLERFLEFAPSPTPRSTQEGSVDPVTSPFSAFVFKIQANMDPDHRDRIAFLRICSGRFERDMKTTHVRTRKQVRLARSTLLMAQEREEVDEAYAGDVVGLFDPGFFRIGDTLCEGGGLAYEGIPTFSPEVFARVEVTEVLNRKALAKGFEQLSQEGAVQLFNEPVGGSALQIVGAVGELQFDVLRHRMVTEYRVDVRLTRLPFTLARWVEGDLDASTFQYSDATRLVIDRDGRSVLLFQAPWVIDLVRKNHPELRLTETAASGSPAAE